MRKVAKLVKAEFIVRVIVDEDVSMSHVILTAHQKFISQKLFDDFYENAESPILDEECPYDVETDNE